jgi:hypothetical protein
MGTVSWDHRGVLLVEFMEKGTTINAASYCATLERLKTTIKRKRLGLVTKGVLILHNNARPHVATATQELLKWFCRQSWNIRHIVQIWHLGIFISFLLLRIILLATNFQVMT